MKKRCKTSCSTPSAAAASGGRGAPRRAGRWRAPLLIGLIGVPLVGYYGQAMYRAIVPPARADCEQLDLAAPGSPRVVIYGTSWCDFCKLTRWHLEDLDVAYCEYDIERSDTGRADFEAMGGKALPLVRVEDERVDGFDKPRLNAALQRHDLI